MVFGTKAKAAAAVLILAASYGMGTVIEHFEGKTFTEEIVTHDEEAVQYIPEEVHIVDGKLNINTATAEELRKLDGIGEKLSERIVAYRTENGAFTQTEGIMKVSGIGQKMYEKIKEQITVE